MQRNGNFLLFFIYGISYTFSIFAKCNSQKGAKKKFENFYCFFLLRRLNTQNKTKKKSKISKCPKVGTVLGPFGSKKGKRDFFLKNLIRPLFTPYTPLTSCKKVTMDPHIFSQKKTEQDNMNSLKQVKID